MVRPGDVVCRWGGDEFVVVLPGASREVAANLAARVRRLRLALDGAEGLEVAASVGVVTFPEDGETLQDLLRAADAAMYLDKRSPRPSSSCEVSAVEEVIRYGLVTVWLQPVVDLRNGRVEGYEALARGPENSPFFQPGKLFAAAERAGLADDLERLCRRRALEAKQRMLPPGHRIFINFDPRLLRCSGQCDTCRAALGLGVPSGEVVLEVSERCDLGRHPEVLADLQRCRARGYLLALDDLGAGFSNLRAVVDLRPEFVKLDTSLIAGLDSDPKRLDLVHLLVQFSRGHGFELIAEGIETESVLEALLRLGVRYGQGYLLGAPAPYPAPVALAAEEAIRRCASQILHQVG